MGNWAVFGDARTWIFLGNGLLVTVQVALAAIILSMVFGVLFALARLARFHLVHYPAVAYIEGIRALPVFLLIIYVFFASARFGAQLPVEWAVVLALTIYTSAVNAEIVRAGILSIEKGQVEAARSLGLTYTQMMRYVVLPQALQRMIPPLVSQFITLLKDTSLGTVIGLLELLRRGEIIYRGTYQGRVNNNPIESLLVVSIIYFILCYSLSGLSLRLERKLAVG